MTTNTREAFAKCADENTMKMIVEYDTIPEMWAHSVAAYGERIAIQENTGSYSFACLDKDVRSFRAVLADRGLHKGDRIGILATNGYDFVKMYLAAVTYGCVAAILPAHLDERTVFGCVMKFGLKAIAAETILKDKLVVAESQMKTLITVLSDAASDRAVPAANLTKKDPAVIMFTGGTTGRSKGALLSNGAVMQGAVNGCYGYKDVFFQRYLLVLPLSHVFGLIRNLMTCLYTGSTLFICKNNKDMFKDIAVFRPTAMVMVPALAEMALNLSKQFGRNMLGPDMKFIICGAATVAPYLVAEYKKFGISLLCGYGLTETANLVSGNPESEKKPESVGFLYPHQEVKVVNGELWIKGENLMEGDVGDDEENALAFEDGFFKTGDLVRFDEEGMLYIVGRCKEVIVLPTGENISPAELEAKFNELDVIQDSQVFEKVTESGAHILALEVVPRMVEVKKLGLADVTSYLKEQLGKVNETLQPYQRVSEIIVRDKDFERTPSMKIVRYKLK